MSEAATSNVLHGVCRHDVEAGGWCDWCYEDTYTPFALDEPDAPWPSLGRDSSVAEFLRGPL